MKLEAQAGVEPAQLGPRAGEGERREARPQAEARAAHLPLKDRQAVRFPERP
jgi:hypothetical protein